MIGIERAEISAAAHKLLFNINPVGEKKTIRTNIFAFKYFQVLLSLSQKNITMYTYSTLSINICDIWFINDKRTPPEKFPKLFTFSFFNRKFMHCKLLTIKSISCQKYLYVFILLIINCLVYLKRCIFWLNWYAPRARAATITARCASSTLAILQRMFPVFIMLVTTNWMKTNVVGGELIIMCLMCI